MSKVYMKVMVSFDTDEKKLIENPIKVVELALKKGVKIDGEVYFPMIDSNEKLYKLYSDGRELNIDDAFDERTITLAD